MFAALTDLGRLSPRARHALLVLYVRTKVEESPAWLTKRARGGDHPPVVQTLLTHWQLVIHVVVLMTAFNFHNHGTRDLYPTFLQGQHHLSTQTTGLIAIIYNIGAILGSGDYRLALAGVVAAVAIAVAIITLLGREARGIAFGRPGIAHDPRARAAE
jgi:SHS family lactate transporter-like MFS transporter